MEIKNIVEGNTLTLEIVGRLDTLTAPQLEEELNTLVTNDITDLVLDFKNLDYISSAGLRVLLAAQKMMNTKGGMKLINVNSEVREVFEITGFEDILTIE